MSRRNSKAPPEEKATEIMDLALDDRKDEESQKLMSQIDDLVDTLGIQDPMQAGSRSRRGSRIVGKHLFAKLNGLGFLVGNSILFRIEGLLRANFEN